MKNILYKQPVILILLLLFISCDNGLDGLNENEKQATTANPAAFFSNATFALSNNIFSIQYRATGPGVARMWAQHITSVTYLEGATYIPEASWTTHYQSVLRNLKESSDILEKAEPLTAAEEKEISNKLAIVEILKVYTYANLVESYGNVPYSEALDFDNPSPKYDDGLTVYLDLIDRLGVAVSGLDEGFNGFSSQEDLIYHGNVEKWAKFANSLKLRMGIRIMDVKPDVGSAAIAQAVSQGVIESNDDNAVFRYLSEYPNTSPWWNFLVRQNLKYYVGTNTFVDKLNVFNDPRRSVYFDALSGGGYKGAQYGITQDYFAYSKVGEYFRAPDLAMVFMDYAQVEFLLAEAAERGVLSVSDAQSHYNNAIRASFDYYGFSESDADDYLAQTSIDYSTAQGTWKEKIGIQKWIALYDQGFEAWTEYRRLDYPKLAAPANADSDIVPLRFLYPINEQTLNGDSYKEAASAIGGDSYSTKLFWDVN